jgi:hypothetical protein
MSTIKLDDSSNKKIDVSLYEVLECGNKATGSQGNIETSMFVVDADPFLAFDSSIANYPTMMMQKIQLK